MYTVRARVKHNLKAHPKNRKWQRVLKALIQYKLKVKRNHQLRGDINLFYFYFFLLFSYFACSSTRDVIQIKNYKIETDIHLLCRNEIIINFN